jgi:uncharacterized protein
MSFPFPTHRFKQALAALLFVLLSLSIARAVEIPKLKGYVNDYADMLSTATEGQLEAFLSDLERRDSTQLVVLTVVSLQGEALEDFSIHVAEAWKVGQKGLDNGAILIIARNDRKIRIETGYGLEGKLTDLVCGRIIRNIVAPHFKRGRFDQGISEALAAMAGVVRGEFTVTDKPGQRGAQRKNSTPLIPLVGLLFLIHVLGRVNRFVGALAGGLLAPLAGALFFNPGLLFVVGLIPIGIIGGLLISLMGGPLSFGPATMRSSGGIWGGGFRSGGGFGSGGFGGFSGGGGGFGGGGASGGW